MIGNLVEMPSGLIVPDYVAEDYFEKSHRPVAIDLFSGCGGFSYGLVQGGFDVIAAADNDCAAAITYTTNLGAYPCQFYFATPEDEKRMEKALHRHIGFHSKKNGLSEVHVSGSGWIKNQPGPLRGCEHFFFGDIRKLTGKAILTAIGMDRGEVDLVVGSPPCQGFSHAGKREVTDPRNSLVFEFARLVCEIYPKTMAMENVPGITSMVTPEGIPVMDALARILEDGHMGTYKALKRSLLGNTEARAIVRGKKRSDISTDEEDEQEELPLFAHLEGS